MVQRNSFFRAENLARSVKTADVRRYLQYHSPSRSLAADPGEFAAKSPRQVFAYARDSGGGDDANPTGSDQTSETSGG